MGKWFFIFLSMALATRAYSQSAQYENLVFEGAGIRGIAYAGVLQELEERGVLKNMVRVGGTSAGAITALMVSLGYTSSEIRETISKTTFQQFNDGQFIFVGGLGRMKKNYGWYKGDAMDRWLGEVIKRKTRNTEITFGELRSLGFKDLYVTATCLNRQNLIIFSSATYPNMKVRDAVRISVSIPLYFEAVFIDGEGRVFEDQSSQENLDVVVDGGIIGNYPIFMFDKVYVDSSHHKVRIPNPKTLGVRIDDDGQIKSDSLSGALAPVQISHFKDYITAFYNIVLESLNRVPLVPEDWERTIQVSSVGISPKIKKMSKGQINALVESGRKGALKYFAKNPPTH